MSDMRPAQVAKGVNDWFMAIPYETGHRIVTKHSDFAGAEEELAELGYGSVRDLLSDEVEIDAGGFTGAAVLPSGKGLDVFFLYWRAWLEPWSDLSWVGDASYEEIGEWVVSQVRLSLQGEISGAAVEVDVCQLFRVRDGQVVVYQAYENREQALAAIESAPPE